ncbi:DUF4952 domain-containing protein [Acaryochloris marina NIES-2412]|uniref:DUF4952 domain-containing protein n=1 Tax=Acaryochloris marina TaxID=155978 RepID=UPI004059E31A
MQSRQDWQSSCLILAILLGVVSDQVQAQEPHGVRYSTQGCGDFLASWDKKPTALKFAGCETGEIQQVGVLTSSYTVQGADAIEIEKFLQSEFGMAPLRFLCCGWEVSPAKDEVAPHNGRYIDLEEARFEVSMYGGETLVRNRRDWHQVPEFRIRVTTYLGEF